MNYQDEKTYLLVSKTNRDFVFCNHRSYEQVIRFADEMIHTIAGESLLSQLNDFQLCLSSELNMTEEDWNKTIFANKYTIPPYYINLFLQKHNLKIV